jgi:hypothetical protein
MYIALYHIILGSLSHLVSWSTLALALHLERVYSRDIHRETLFVEISIADQVSGELESLSICVGCKAENFPSLSAQILIIVGNLPTTRHGLK